LEAFDKLKKLITPVCICSPKIDIDSFRLTITSIYKWDLRQIDIKAAYLNDNLDEKIYVQISMGDKNFSCIKSGLLHKTLYGLKQNERQWFYEIFGFFFSLKKLEYSNIKIL